MEEKIVKMKKSLLSFVLALCLILPVMFILTACDNEHEHVYSTEWSADEMYHWHACVNENCSEVIDKQIHSGGTASYTEKAKCDVCEQGYGEVLGVAKVDGIGYATLEQACSVANDEDTITILIEDTYELPSSSLQNKNIILEGTKEVILDLSSLHYLTGTSIKFKNITAQFDATTDYQGLGNTEKVVYEDCVILGKQVMYSDAEFIDCVFENKNDYCVWTWESEIITFTNCVFNTGGKAILVYNGATSSNFVADVELTNCVFNDDDTLDTIKGAVETGSGGKNTSTSNKYNITFIECSVNGFAENNSESTFWGNKDNMDSDHLFVVIDGVDVF